MKRALPSLVAIALIVLGFGFLFAQSTPVGTVKGRVVFHRNDKPFADAIVFLDPEGSSGTRLRTRTDANGYFSFRHVPVGRYSVVPRTERHHTLESGVTVREAQTAEISVPLITDEPELSLAYTQQRIFSTKEAPKLPVTGIGDKGDPIAITVFRTRISELMVDPKAEAALREVGNRWGDNNPAILHKSLQRFIGSPFAQGSTPIARADSEGYFTQRVPLPNLEHHPGLYFVRLDHAKKRTWSWILVTDTALVTFRSLADKTLLAFAVDLQKGTPRVGATVRLFVNGEEQTQGTTDRNGLARLAVGSQPTESRREATVVTVGEDEAIVAANSPVLGNNSGLVGHIITDRPLYRPGHTVHYKALLRQHSNSGDGFQIPVGERAEVTVTDPNNLVLLQETKTVSASGAVVGEFTVNPEGATGFYSVEVKLGSRKIQSSVEFASYRKPEFEVSVTPKRKRVLHGELLEATVAANYYFGSPVPNAKVRWHITRQRDWSADDEGDSSWREEDNEEGDRYGEYVETGTTTLDATGHATIQLPAQERKDESADDEEAPAATTEPPQVETYTITASVEDSAERQTEASASVKVTTADLRVTISPEGYLATAGKATRLFVSTYDHEGKPLSNIPITVQPTQSKYDPKTKKTTPVAVGAPLSATTSTDGRAIVSFTPPISGDLDLKTSAKDSAGRVATTHQNLWVTSDNDREPSTYSSGLTLATDKKRYEPGETAKVVLGAAETGQTALLTLEGDRLYETIPVTIRQKVTVLQIPVKPEYGPNVSLHACYIYNKQLASSETPLRVALPQKTLTVTITPQKPQYEPGQSAQFDVALTDSKGKPVVGELSFSLADESIYALKEDDPKALRQTFYPHRTSQIRTQHSFEIVYLAGDEKDGPQVVARKKFVDTAYWNAALTTDATGHASVSVPLPDNLTTWRATVNASTPDTAVGFGRGKIVVNRPFFVRLDTPRFVVEGDRVRVQGLVHNNTGSAQTAHVRLAAPGITDPEKTLSVASGTIGEATWEWTVPPITESAKLTLTGWTEDRRYTDAVEQPLTVRPFAREELRNLALGSDGKLTLALSAEAAPERSFVTLRVSPSLKEIVAEACDYLKKYPYGCVEQTVSRFVPLIAAGEADKELVAEGVTRLGSLLQGDNGWGWWYKDKTDLFLTSYALWGLAEARDAGFAVPKSLLEQGSKPLWTLIGDKSPPRPETAFALYSLSRVDGSRMRRQGVEALTARLKRFGDPEKKRADTLAWLVLFTRTVGLDSAPYVDALEKKATTDGAFVHWNVPEDRWNATDRMTTALALRALLLTRPQSPQLAAGLRYLLSTSTDGYFGDTRDTAFVVTTLCKLPQLRERDNGVLPIVSLNGKPLTLQTNTRGGFELRLPATALQPGTNTLESNVSLTAAVRESKKVPPGPLPALDAKTVTVRREYVKLASGPKGLIPEAPSLRFAQGDTVRVRLIVETKEPLEYLLLEDRFPAGFEPNARGTVDEEDTYHSWNFWYSHIDVRDDRLAVFARSIPAGKYTYEYHLRAQTPGTTHALPAALTPMYGTILRAESSGEIIEIH